MKTNNVLIEKINKELKIFFDKKIADLKDDFFIDITKSLAEYTLRGGKRIRPIFMLYGYKAITGKINHDVIKLSIFLELIQSSLLIHDDIMDQDILRRGGITIHEKYAKYFKKKNSHFGESIAIVIGDIAMNFAFEIIANSIFSAEIKNKLVYLVSKYVSQVDYGQSVDIKLAHEKKYDEKDIYNVHYYKTMIYTTMMPLIIGSTLGKADKNQEKTISQYAKNTGIAFQIQDDIMGIFGDEKKLGKPIGSDLSENKKTLLTLKALEKANIKQKKVLNNLLGKDNITKQEIEEFQKIVTETGSLKYSKDLAHKYIETAIKTISQANINKKTKKELVDIATYIINRDK